MHTAGMGQAHIKKHILQHCLGQGQMTDRPARALRRPDPMSLRDAVVQDHQQSGQQKTTPREQQDRSRIRPVDPEQPIPDLDRRCGAPPQKAADPRQQQDHPYVCQIDLFLPLLHLHRHPSFIYLFHCLYGQTYYRYKRQKKQWGSA